MVNRSLKRVVSYRKTDNKQTPEKYAKFIVDYFKPEGIVLEPCKGDGNFFKFFPKGSLYCDITEGKDFFDFNQKVDWIITNPPWVYLSEFLKHSFELADNVVMVFTYHYLGTKRRFKMLREYNFWIKEILLIPTPEEWGGWGLQLAVYYFKKNYIGDTKITYIEKI